MARVSESKVRLLYPELLLGSGFLLVGLCLLAAASFAHRLPPPLTRSAFYLAGMLLVLAAGEMTTFFTARARQRGHRAPRGAVERSGKKLPSLLRKLRDLGDRLWVAIVHVDWLGDWLPLGLTLACGLLSLYALMRGWESRAPHGAAINQIIGGVLLAAAFPLLVLERRYAGIPATAMTEAPALAQLCRVPLLGFVALAIAAGLRWLGLGLATPLEHAIAVLTGLVAAELVVRSAAYVFVPLPPLADRRGSFSLVAGLIRARPPSLKAINASVRNQFGIDLARSWALGFVRRAAVPLLAGMAVLSWLLTGVTALGINERAVYEAFGHTEGVLHPGIHVHWPWPFGVLRKLDYGTVNEIAIELSADGKVPAAAHKTGGSGDIEGAPRPQDDGLWDTAHDGAEGSYLVAALSNGQQSFEAVDIDISIVYRTGLSDQDAIQSVYRIAAPEDSVQAISGQILSRYFARYTIDHILSQNRDVFIRNFQKELQARLTALSSGIEVMAVVVQGIHPPPAAADSYQGVQAAAIESVTKVSIANAESAREMKMAQVVATATRNDAAAAAAERASQAKMDFTLFDGDRKAYAAGGPSFLFERRLDRLDKGLADKPLIVMDHRIAPNAMPTFDMRGGARPKASFGDPDAD